MDLDRRSEFVLAGTADIEYEMGISKPRKRPMSDDTDLTVHIELTAEVVSAYVSNNPLAADQLPGLIASVYNGISGLASGAPAGEEAEVAAEPAVSIRKSLKSDQLTCLECGKTFKSIRRHLNTSHDLTPQQYREKWGLKSDYPMVAPEYSATRSKMALDLGLGRKSKAAAD